MLAAVAAPTTGVVDIALQLIPHLSFDQAVAIAVRAKRGVDDLNGPGGITKDHLYLTGLSEVSDLLAADPPALSMLQATKWSLALLPMATDALAAGDLRPDTVSVETLRHIVAQVIPE